MAVSAEKVVSDIGKRLAQQTRPNKGYLVKFLRQAAGALSELSQSSSLHPVIEPLSDSLVQHSLLQHKDKDVRLLVAICFSEIIRVLAPDPPYTDEILRDIFKLIVSMFVELADMTSPYFSRRVKILETVAALKCCVLMLDIGCEDLVLDMFNIFFSVVREHHQQSLIQAMLSIMTLILEEKVSQPLLDVILLNLLKEGKGGPPASSRLAVSLIQHCTEKLEPFVRGLLTSCILDKDTVTSELKEFHHEIIFEIFQCAPQMLLAVIPNLTQELLTDQVDVRIKAVNLLGKLFALPERHVAQEYRHLFVEFLKRFSDKSAEVRVSALQCAKACYMANPSGTESLEVIAALEERLLDFDDKVRTQAVIVVCDLAKSNLKFVPSELISRATERLRDKKVSVRKNAMYKLLELYRAYCTKCSEGLIALSDHFEQIPCRILMLCYDKDCKEFRPQNMELVLAEDLFPAPLSVEERTRHWLSLFSFFTPPHIKALNSILSQKRRLQTEMQVYLSLRKEEKENGSEEVQKRIKTSFMKMITSFVDPSKAEECFLKLHKMKDNSIFNGLLQLLDDGTIITAQNTRDKFLEKIGDKHPLYDFLRILSAKCLANIFSSEHVHCILDHLSRKNVRDKHLEASSVSLLLAVISIFPSLLRGSEEQLRMLLLEDNNPSNEKLIQMLAKAGPHISIKFSDIYPSLERVCLEGTRMQSKYAVSAIAALTGASGQLVFSELCKKLVDSLHNGKNIPTVLQSLGCIAQYSMLAFDTREKEITQCIIQNFLCDSYVEPSDDLASFDEASGCSISCKLKIYGLKTLVKSFLPHQGTDDRHQIKELLNILLKMLPKGDISDGIISSESDKAHIRLTAAKSVLRLARRWDLHISPQIFHVTILKARDPSSFVRRLFLDKIHKLLKDRAIPSRYACAFALAASDCLNNVQDDSFKYLAEFIKEYSREAQVRQTSTMQGGTMTTYPEYIVVFLIHVLAHDLGFPSENCQDEEIYAQFCSPLVIILQALVNASFVDSSKNVVNDTVSYLLSIFRAIRKADDAVDARRTHKLHILADLGVLILKVLSRNGISSSHSPGLVLLPSSFYKVSLDTKSEEANTNSLTGCFSDKNFIERVFHTFESHLSQPNSYLAKRGRKIQEDSLLSDAIKCNTMNLQYKKDDLLMSRTNEERDNLYPHGVEPHKTVRQQVSTKGKNKRALSPIASRSTGMVNECPVVSEHKKGAPGNTEPNRGKDHLSSSCGSVTTKPSLSESQVSTQEIDLINCSSLEENDRETKSSSIAAEAFKYSKTNLKVHCNSKDVGNKSEVTIGQRIKLWSPVDKCFYSGTVDGFDSQNSTHKITYDNGEVELLRLANENWETVSIDSLSEKEVNEFHSQHWKYQERFGQAESSYGDPGADSSISSLEEIVDAFRDKASKKQRTLSDKRKGNFDNENIPFIAGAVKGKKEQKQLASVNTSSNIINSNENAIARRTRSRKA